MQRLIYADYNATTPIGPMAKAAMVEALDIWGNPSSSHGIGRRAKEKLEKARGQVATACCVQAKDVVFLSGGSEANAQAILGMHFMVEDLRVVTAETEHSSVLDSIRFSGKRGARVLWARVLPTGAIDINHLESVIQDSRPHLVTLMAANNETGVVLPMAQVRELCTRYGSVFHCDCVQAFGKLPPQVWNSADLLSLSSHKIYGPKGVGALVIRSGQKLVPLPFGGAQETKRRGGTQNMIGIMGFGGAAEEISDIHSPRLESLRNRFESTLLGNLEGVSVNGAAAQRVSNTSNLRFSGIVAEVLLSILDLEGISVSAGSACSSGSILPSPVLLSMGLTKNEARECLRFSWGRETTQSEVDAVAEHVIQNVTRIRARGDRRNPLPPVSLERTI